MKAALIDNYDSFTYNLKALIASEGVEIDVFRNDQVSLDQLKEYDFLVFSPGPSLPKDAGDLLTIIDHYKHTKPMLGVCLGMQAIGQIFGAELKLLKKPLHGISKMVTHFGDPIFSGMDSFFEAARYHSWVIDKEDIPHNLEVIAISVEKEVMAIRHIDLPIFGFQFHPESVLTAEGNTLIKNFLEQVKQTQNETLTREVI